MLIRTVVEEDLAGIIALEDACFLQAEVATKEALAWRIETFPDYFWVMEAEGNIVALLNGMLTDTALINDEMFTNASLHRDSGSWYNILSLCVLPAYRQKGYGKALMELALSKIRGEKRKGAVLTCKEPLIPYYENIGFKNRGISCSQHGGSVWYDMALTF